ncbi:thioredoxin domain-containing protein [Brooklawnia cerclae]|uniref:Protein-disulfide isomerase n=1 Tax=Brooklawnia cerclae TaxID=349934 RepID=A0ABX0SIT8_9ACTN|nr:thioredoxin domain-containing protein [Brooklawnia cerclae]NIH56662.1 protein-disulfide isomerase [Brooklawnia cerclae]
MSKNKQNLSSPPSGGANRREQLRQQQAQAAREKKARTVVTFSVLGVALAVIVGVVVWGIASATRNSSTSQAQASGAATEDYSLVIGEQDAPVTVAIYQDFMCPYCGQFERTNRDDLEALVADGTTKVEFHLMNFLDSSSQGTNYSTRAANALVTVAKSEPEHVMALNAALYDNQPDEGTSGLSDTEIADLASEAGVSDAVISTFADLSNADFVDGSNDAAAADGVTSTPTIKINGEEFSGSQIYTAGMLKSAVEDAAGR